MGSLIKMDLRRLTLSKVFYTCMAIIAAVNILWQIAIPLFVRMFAMNQPLQRVQFSNFVAQPFALSIMIVVMVISIVSFTFADFANGYIKNIAGQVAHKSHIILSKFIVVGVHNCIIMLAGVLSLIIGGVVASLMGVIKLEFDALLPQAFLTFFIKWMLSMAISSIMLFLTNGVRNKTVATVVGVILGTGALGMVYLGLNEVVKNVFKINDFSIGDYAPDQLINSVSVGGGIAVFNAIIVALVCSALFLVISVKVFDSRDVK